MRRASGSASVVLSVALALALASAFSGCSETRTSESTGQYVDDTSISTKVRAALLQDQALKTFDVHVHTYKNVVQLSGFVNSSELKERASTVASNVNGVHAVQNNLIVK